MDGADLVTCLQAGLADVGVVAAGLQCTREVTGGIVNKAALFQTRKQKFLVKWNAKQCTQSMFHSERESLKVLARTNLFKIPKSVTVCRDHTGDGGLHVLEFIDNLAPLTRWRQLGHKMARLHCMKSTLLRRNEAESSRVTTGNKKEDPNSFTPPTLAPVRHFGFHVPPYLGDYSPGSVWRVSWQEFFTRDILKPFIDWAEKKYSDRQMIEGWARLQPNINKVFQNAVILPELLHGDFCYANVGQTDTDIVLFDPSCMYGDADFGLTIALNEPEFHQDFFSAYREVLPTTVGNEKKMALYKFFFFVIMWCYVDEATFREGAFSSLQHLETLLA